MKKRDRLHKQHIKTAANNKDYIAEYILLGPNRETVKRQCARITKIIHNTFQDVFQE